jgi:hypothetical protein
MTPLHGNVTIPRLALWCAVIALVAVLEAASTCYPEETAPHPLSVVQAGPKAIDLKVWAEKAEGDSAKEGTPVLARVKASDKGYLTAIFIAPNGDAIVLLPNKDMPVCLIVPEKDYTFFGPDSHVMLEQSELIQGAKINFYLSSSPLPIGELRIPPGEMFMRIAKSASKEMLALSKALERLAKDPTFNRQELSLRGPDKKGLRLELMDLPPDVTSTKPIGVTGAPGLKDKMPESGKE